MDGKWMRTLGGCGDEVRTKELFLEYVAWIGSPIRLKGSPTGLLHSGQDCCTSVGGVACWARLLHAGRGYCMPGGVVACRSGLLHAGLSCGMPG
eukprot:135343-Chlamydomonas_euryale.AAC.3